MVAHDPIERLRLRNFYLHNVYFRKAQSLYIIKKVLFRAVWVLAYQRSLILHVCMTIILSTSRELRILLDCTVRRRHFLPCGSKFSIEIDSNSRSVMSHATTLY